MTKPKTDKEKQMELATVEVCNMVSKYQPQIALALPKHLSPDRMTRILITEVRRNPLLAVADRDSFFGAVIQCAQLGLEPGGGLGQVYLVPFWSNSKGCYEVQIIIGYQGMVELAERSGLVTISSGVIYENDVILALEKGTDEVFRLKPSFGKSGRGEIIGSFAVAKYKDGRAKFELLNMEDIEHARSYSKSSKKGPWVDHFAAMAKKTAIRALFKLVPKSPEIRDALMLDEKLESGEGQNLGNVLEDFKKDRNVVIDVGTAPQIEAEREELAQVKTILFSSKNPEQVKEVTEIMKNMKVASNTQNQIIDELEGKDIEADLMRLIKEHS